MNNEGEDFLNEFIKQSRGEKREETEEQESVADTNDLPSPVVKDTWTDIEEALRRWTNQIVDAESRYESTATFRGKIEASLRRQQLDGFLTPQDISELRYIANIWVNLLNCTSSYTIGCEFVKRDIITYLLELYNLRQITDRLFIETCLRL